MHGKLDYVVPFSHAEEMKRYFNDQAILIPFENVGHSCITDDLDLFVSTVRTQVI